ncbi:MAG TPA: hypothetical protein VLF14_07885, partial [Candidatus Binatia bacterium]|nr:hypothetical protein [Candidatus Binatia bacterium]
MPTRTARWADGEPRTERISVPRSPLRPRKKIHFTWKSRFSPSALLWILSGAPWTWSRISDDGSPARFVHRALERSARRLRGPAGRGLPYAGFVAGMPAVVSIIAICTAIHGARVRRETGKGRIRQVREQLELWLRKGVLPLSYYAFELYQDGARGAALDYLYRCETKGAGGAYALLRARFSSAETTEALRDKASFAERCRERGVPAVPVLFAVERGRITRFDTDEPGLPRCDLFLKPLSGSGGRGAALCAYLGSGRYRSGSARVSTESDLVRHL